MKRVTLSFLLTLLLVSVLVITSDIKVAKSSSTIKINPDGSINPPTANIVSLDNVTYTFTDNISIDQIWVARSNIIIDGDGYTLQGNGYGDGFRVGSIGNITVKNTNIKDFTRAVWLESSNNIITENNITACDWGIHLWSSSNNIISGNNMISNALGIRMDPSSNNNNVSGNTIKLNWWGIWINSSSSNTISRNTIANSSYGIWLRDSCNNNNVSRNIIINNTIGLRLDFSYNNRVHHNNFINNHVHAGIVGDMVVIWDEGFEGNFWSDYNGTDFNGDGIGDTPYVIKLSNMDNYPFMKPYLWWNIADVNYDFKVDIFDVVLTAGAYGSTPSDPNYNAHCDIIEPYVKIDIFDIVMICQSYGEEYTP